MLLWAEGTRLLGALTRSYLGLPQGQGDQDHTTVWGTQVATPLTLQLRESSLAQKYREVSSVFSRHSLGQLSVPPFIKISPVLQNSASPVNNTFKVYLRLHGFLAALDNHRHGVGTLCTAYIC